MKEVWAQARALINQKPKAKLGFFPTPLYKLEKLSEQLGVEIYVKRDDFTGMNQFGGNKIRKLEYLMGDALLKRAEYVFTYGATQSNHAMQTVTACRKYGLRPVIYLVAFVTPDDNDLRSNLLLDQIMGAEVHIVDIREGETEAQAEERSFLMSADHIRQLEEEGHVCYPVPMGGANSIGSTGFVDGFVEMEEQLDALGVSADYLFHATGTGGTLAGLVAGKKLTSSRTMIIAIPVSYKTEEYLGRVAKLANDTLDHLGSPLRVDAKQDLFMDTNYYMPGYERPNAMASEAIRLLARTEGLFLDPVYTGRVFAGLLDYIRTGKVEQGSRVVFWHTGGTTALFAEKEILGDIVRE